MSALVADNDAAGCGKVRPHGRLEPRIVICAGGFAPVGGIESFIFDLATGLAGRGLLVSITCWGERGALLPRLELSGVPVRRRAWRWGCRWGWPDKIMMRGSWKQILNADVLVFGKLLHAGIHHRLAKCEKRMILVTPYRPKEMWAERRPDDAILNSFVSIVVQASEFADDLRSLGYRGRVVVLPYIPPAIAPVTPLLPDSPLRIGFLGRLVPDKNVGGLILAFSAARRSGLDAELHVFGDGAERRHLQNEAERAGLSNVTFFHGSKARSELAGAIDSCHLFAFTSRSEGQCLAALEILARGRPVVATPVGAFPHLLSDYQLGVLAQTDGPDAFANALVVVAQAIKANSLTPDRVQAAYCKRFSRAQVIDEYTRLFQSITATLPGRAGDSVQ